MASSSALSFRSAVAGPSNRVTALAPRPSLRAAPRASVRVAAKLNAEDNSRVSLPEPLANAIDRTQKVLSQYDFLSASMGALCVTGYFVMKGQDPFTALSITGTSAVIAVVVNEIIMDFERKQ